MTDPVLPVGLEALPPRWTKFMGQAKAEGQHGRAFAYAVCILELEAVLSAAKMETVIYPCGCSATGTAPVPRNCPDHPLREGDERLRSLAKQAVNGWACHARTHLEHDEIARLHREIDKVEAVLSAEPRQQEAVEEVACEGCDRPTASIFITADDVELCKSCYDEVPVTEQGEGGPFGADQSNRPMLTKAEATEPRPPVAAVDLRTARIEHALTWMVKANAVADIASRMVGARRDDNAEAFELAVLDMRAALAAPREDQ